MTATNNTGQPFEGWAILELMGHRVRPGYVTEVEMAGTKLLRVDIHLRDGAVVTEFYGGASLYSLRPCTEDVARGEAKGWSDPRPVRPAGFRERDDAQPRLFHDGDGGRDDDE